MALGCRTQAGVLVAALDLEPFVLARLRSALQLTAIREPCEQMP